MILREEFLLPKERGKSKMGKEKLLGVMDKFISLIMMMGSWVYAYLQRQ